MALDYTTLTGAKTVTNSIRSWVNHSAIPASDILTEAEAYIYERVRAWEMRQEASISAASGGSVFTLPTDFLAPIKLLLDGHHHMGLTYLHEELFVASKDEDGELYESAWPNYWTIMGEQGLLDVKLTETRNGDLWYYQRPEALSGSNTTNFLTVKFPTLLRRTCTMFGYEYRKDWQAFERELILVEGAIERANQHADSVRRGAEW